jgi:hypothetical protein
VSALPKKHAKKKSTATHKNTTTKKTVAKKSTNQKTTSTKKKPAVDKKATVRKKQVTVKVAPHEYFVLSNGAQIQDYIELANMLEQIDDAVFSHHVNEHKNDFAQWIHHVFKEEELAKRLATANNKKDARFVIYEFLVTKHLK